MKWFRSEITVIFCLATAASIASLYQLFVYLSRTPAGFVYPLVHNYVPDYYWYVSLMRQGWEGSLALTSLYTPEHFAPKLVNTFFPLLGFVARVFRLSLPFAYTVARVLGAIALLVAGYQLSVKLFHQQRGARLLAFMLMIFGAPMWHISQSRIEQAGEFWTGFDPILRVTFLPHHLFANTLYIFSLLFIITAVEKKRFVYALGAGVLAGLAGFLNPATLIALTLSLIFSAARMARSFPSWWRPYLVVCVFVAAVGWWLWRVQQSVFPWTAFASWERFVFYPIDRKVLLEVLGPAVVFACIGFIVRLHKRDIAWALVAGWFAAPFVGIEALSRFLPLSNGRYFQVAPYIPTAILASAGICWVAEVLKKRNIPSLVSHSVMAITLIVLALPSFVASIQRQRMYVAQNMSNTLVYVSGDWMDAFKWIAQYRPKEVIAAPEDVSTLIPAFTGGSTLAGHPTFTYEPDQKRMALMDIYDTGNAEGLEKYHVGVVWVPKELKEYVVGKFPSFTVGYENKSIALFVREK